MSIKQFLALLYCIVFTKKIQETLLNPTTFPYYLEFTNERGNTWDKKINNALEDGAFRVERPNITVTGWFAGAWTEMRVLRRAIKKVTLR